MPACWGAMHSIACCATSNSISTCRIWVPRIERQETEKQGHPVREVTYDLTQRIRQELAFPAVVDLYAWLLKGMQHV